MINSSLFALFSNKFLNCSILKGINLRDLEFPTPRLVLFTGGISAADVEGSNGELSNAHITRQPVIFSDEKIRECFFRDALRLALADAKCLFRRFDSRAFI
jgi:hypothetical protein